MKKTAIILALAVLSLTSIGQKKVTNSAQIMFDATTSIDDLPRAVNKTVIAAFDPTERTVAFEASIKNFNFSNPMMQDHFNAASWLDSEKYPSAKFTGKLINKTGEKLSKSGTYEVEVEGELTIHGVTNKVKTTATVRVNDNKYTTKATFKIKLKDYNISGNAIAAGKVAAETTISITADF